MKEKKYQLAQINVARIKGVNIDDPIMKEFVDNLDVINKIAEQNEGFVWRLKDESNSAVNLNPFNDDQVIINISVWQDVESLENFVYNSFHSNFLKRRKEWFNKYGRSHFALWWIVSNQYPTIEAAISKLEELETNGSSKEVFNFRKKFSAPDNTGD